MNGRRRRSTPDLAEIYARGEMHACTVPDCSERGLYPAPRSRAQFRPYLWFCLDHVRIYNAGWDFYAGMSAEEIEREIRRDSVWRRPSWRLGERKALSPADVFGLFGDASNAPEPDAAARWGLTPEAAEALAQFSLAPPVTLVEIKARYKQLVKENHPDVHGGDRAAEERLKTINLAYASLVRFFGGDLRPKRSSTMSPQESP